MKQTIYIAICLIGILSAASCSRHQDVNALLVHADSAMEAHPDSALNILQNIGCKELNTQEEHAYYALLLTQARDKNYIAQTDDSLIQTAVHYYDSIGDVHMQAKAHYYKGSVHRDANRCGEAIHEYLTAIQFAEKTENKKLLGLIYNQAGYLYYLQNLLEDADSIYQRVEELAIQQNDTSLWADALTFQGKICMERGGKYSKAEQMLKDAYNLVNTPKYKRAQANIAASLSSLYSRMNEAENAIRYAKLNISLRDDTTNCYNAFLLLGDAYYKAGQYNSATVYLNKSLSSTGYGTKANAYMRLAEIAKAEGDHKKSSSFTEKYSIYTDSLHSAHQSNDIINVEKELESQHYTNILRSKEYMLLASIIASILFIGISAILLRKYRKKTNSLQQSKSQLELKQQKLQEEALLFSTELNQKEAQLAALTKELAQIEENEEHWQQLNQDIETKKSERNALVKESFEHSKVYAKIERIIDSYKKCDKSDEKLTEEDWEYIIVQMDKCWNENISRLSAQYKLSKEEVHLCCLFLTDIPVAQMPYLISYTRNTIYRKEKEIIKKMGYTETTVKLKDILKKY